MDGKLLNALEELYREVDRVAGQVAAGNPWLACAPGCTDCCLDDLTIFEIEAKYILGTATGLHGQSPSAVGGCAFLSASGECRIYDSRPYVCRTQGLPLRWFEDPSDEASPEWRDVCPVSTPPIPLEAMHPGRFFLLGEFEGRLATLQMMCDPQMTRVPLRALFHRLSTGAGQTTEDEA